MNLDGTVNFVPTEGSQLERKEFQHKLDLATQLTMGKSRSEELVRFMMYTVGQGTAAQSKPVISPDLVRSFLKKFGLSKLADDQDLVQDMVQCCYYGPSTPVKFDVNSFIRALTHDVLLFDVDREHECTTNYFDVFHSSPTAGGAREFKRSYKAIDKISQWSDKTSCLDSNIDVEAFCRKPIVEDDASNTTINDNDPTITEDVTKSWTCSCIDSSADTMRTKFLKFTLLFGFLAAIYSHTNYIDRWASDHKSNTCSQNEHTPQAAFCEMGLATGTYILRGLVCGFLGWVYVGLGSLGNSVHERNVIPICISICIILGFNLYFLIVGQESMQHDGKLFPPKLYQADQAATTAEIKWKDQINYAVFVFHYLSDQATSNTEWKWKDQKNYAVFVFHYLSIGLGFLAILVQVLSLLRIALLRNIGKQEEYRSILFRHQIVRAEAKLKQACSRKLNSLVENARKIHDHARDPFDPDKDLRRRAMKTFRSIFNEDEKVERKIGMFWALKEVYSGK